MGKWGKGAWLPRQLPEVLAKGSGFPHVGTGCCHGDLLAALLGRRPSQVPFWPSGLGTGGQSSGLLRIIWRKE